MRPCADRTRTWRFTRKRSRITRAQIAEDLGQVAAGLALDQHGGGEELGVEHGNALAEVAEGVGKRHAEVLPIVEESKLRADRRRASLRPPARCRS